MTRFDQAYISLPSGSLKYQSVIHLTFPLPWQLVDGSAGSQSEGDRSPQCTHNGEINLWFQATKTSQLFVTAA